MSNNEFILHYLCELMFPVVCEFLAGGQRSRARASGGPSGEVDKNREDGDCDSSCTGEDDDRRRLGERSDGEVSPTKGAFVG
jgi:hypothetical protein